MATSRNSYGVVPLPTAIQRYFGLALYLLVLTGFGALASTGRLDSPTVLLTGGALLLRGYLLAKKRALLIPEYWTTILTLLYVLFYLADYVLLSRSFLTATVHLVLFVMVVRLFSAQRDRDHYFLAVLAFLMVLAAAVLTVDSTFLLALAGFLLVAIVTFILMEMRHASGKASVHSKDPTDVPAHRQMAFSLASLSPVLMLLILFGAAAIFFILPRISTGYLSSFAPGGELATGFSNEVQLGRIGQIQQSNSTVMHIEIDGDKTGRFDLKWRGVAFRTFDGKTWTTSPMQSQSIVPRLGDGRFALWQMAREPGLTRIAKETLPIHYRVLMEPLGTNVFFLAVLPHSMQGNYRVVSVDVGSGVYDSDPEHPIGLYDGWSDIARPSAKELRGAPTSFPPKILSSYLQLPPLDLRIPELAKQIAAKADNNYDKAVAIETYLRTKYAYTLQLPETIPADPLANFLFERKQGHCEYFASSMAVMLRAIGIPSRVVNGFRGGEFNDLTSQYVVRSRDAHSWVEVYFPDHGWVDFDPTPAGTGEIHSGWGRVMLYMDAMASFWREWIINYDVGHQRVLGQQAVQSSRQMLRNFHDKVHHYYRTWLSRARRMQRNITASPGRWSFVGGLTTVLLLLAANFRRLWQAFQRRRLALHPQDAPKSAATIWYERMLRLLARRGWRKSMAQTPEEFASAIPKEGLRQHVARFTAHYECARFGGSANDAQRLPELYKEIVTASRD